MLSVMTNAVCSPRLLELVDELLCCQRRQWELITAPEARTRICRSNVFGDFYDMGNCAAVGAASKQNHIGSEMTNAFDFLIARTTVVGRQCVHDNRPGAQCAPLGAFGAHRLYDACHHDL
jgi:hypothetical protein